MSARFLPIGLGLCGARTWNLLRDLNTLLKTVRLSARTRGSGTVCKSEPRASQARTWGSESQSQEHTSHHQAHRMMTRTIWSLTMNLFKDVQSNSSPLTCLPISHLTHLTNLGLLDLWFQSSKQNFSLQSKPACPPSATTVHCQSLEPHRALLKGKETPETKYNQTLHA